jgi:tetratricopeptide (TPR) repeat protein
MSEEIQKAIESENWEKARSLIRERLKKSPGNHWLITRLGLTYYEQRQYKRSLNYSKKAIKIAPNCPLVLWDYAGSLDMLNYKKEAISIYKRIISKGLNQIAYGKCGEGKAWARGLIADCHYRLACCYKDIGCFKKSLEEYKYHFALRGPGCHSVYNIKEIRKEVLKLKK